jgi:hypothetical protein
MLFLDIDEEKKKRGGGKVELEVFMWKLREVTLGPLETSSLS